MLKGLNPKPPSRAQRGARANQKMTPLPRSVIAALQYQELLQCCHELFHIALAANANSCPPGMTRGRPGTSTWPIPPNTMSDAERL